MSERNISSVNSLLNSLTRNAHFQASWDMFRRMHRVRSDLNSYTFTPTLGACSALPNPLRGRQVHALMIKLGLDGEVITKTALMNMYSKYGLLDDSVLAFEEIRFKDVVTWNAMLSSFLRHDLPFKALDVFKEMREQRVEFSEFSLCSVVKACALLSAYKQGKQVHGLVTVMGRDLVVLGTALIDFYSRVGHIGEAIKIYRGMSGRKDDIMCNSMISGCIRNKKYDFAMSIMSSMRPNAIALTSALSACSENSDLWIGKQIHGVTIRQGFTYDTQLCNVMLDMYAKCGKISSGRLVFEGIPRKDVVSWTSMIDAYGSHGHGLEAFMLFKKMGGEGNGVLPNSVTYLSVLSACAHADMVEEGCECFVTAQEDSVDLGPEHYACFIDLLSRSGRTDEIWRLFDDMVKDGIKPTAEIWTALLNACRINHDVVRGELSANHLLELEPNNPGHYIALSNFYAAIGAGNEHHGSLAFFVSTEEHEHNWTHLLN
ncbi:Pentatricopeptide repeat-containing protein [Heracleum sosnowskyi]|uniref:Pentatricopeptide repeat-containing protein n=1 Tax=Heracleum sosnowskyi TaxID=360622 RepID=A0AAD8MIQ3_9APIA|nr:Pentatricopeptide repeat-containing protein [Heracleum sosnowskyi]